MKKKFLYIVSALLILGAAGCEKIEDFGDTNIDPNAVNDPIPSSLLANAANSVKGLAFQINPGYYAQYFSESQYPGVSVYTTQQPSFTGSYSGSMYDMQNIISLSTSSVNQKNVAKILMQYTYWNLTDQFGDIPYSEALQGVDNSSPKYDTQEEIYKGILSTLKSVASSFDNSTLAGDILMNQDVAAWKRVNNSIRLLVSLQLSKKYPGASDYAATEFKEALADAGGVITTNAQNFKANIAAGYKSSYWSLYDGRKDVAVSDVMIGLLESLNDTRINAFTGASEAPGSTASSNIGVPYGVPRADVLDFTAQNPSWARVLRGDLRTENSPVYIITASQIALARAEAANMGWTTDNLQAQYETGIALSFDQWGLTIPATYLTQPDVAIGAAGAGNVEKIAIQRYLAHFPDGQQAWNITRKLGYPALTPAPDAQNSSGQIPNRYMYAPTEFQTNKESADAAVARLTGGNTQDAKVWWAQ